MEFDRFKSNQMKSVKANIVYFLIFCCFVIIFKNFIKQGCCESFFFWGEREELEKFQSKSKAIYELSGCGFESRCSPLNMQYFQNATFKLWFSCRFSERFKQISGCLLQTEKWEFCISLKSMSSQFCEM